MAENLTKKLKKKKGFTLIELIIVVAIIAILAGLAIPKLMGTQEKSKKTADIANAKLIHDTAAKLITEGKIKDAVTFADVSAKPDAAGDDKDLYDAMQTHPTPKYKKYAKFKVTISSDLETITVSAIEDGASAKDVQVYPDPEGDYAETK